jgi:HK97 family phage prohead protease
VQTKIIGNYLEKLKEKRAYTQVEYAELKYKIIMEIRTGTGLAAAGRTIEGYAILFNEWSTRLAGFREMILPEACTQKFIDTQDVKCRYNHLDSTGILARSNKGQGTLKLTVDSKGLKYSFVAKDTSLSNEVLEMIRNGEITESSFSFSVTKDGERVYKDSDGTLCRVISKFSSLTDVAPVLDAAYETSVGVRKQLEIDLKELEKKLVENVVEAKEDKNYKWEHRYDALKFKNDSDFKEYMKKFKMKYGTDAEIKKIKYNEAFQKDLADWLKAHPDLAAKAKEERENKDS